MNTPTSPEAPREQVNLEQIVGDIIRSKQMDEDIASIVATEYYSSHETKMVEFIFKAIELKEGAKVSEISRKKLDDAIREQIIPNLEAARKMWKEVFIPVIAECSDEEMEARFGRIPFSLIDARFEASRERSEERSNEFRERLIMAEMRLSIDRAVFPYELIVSQLPYINEWPHWDDGL